MAAIPPAPDAETRAERHLRVLALLAEKGLELACDLQAAALAATEPQEKVRFAQGFHHLGRSVRQSIALEARLAREGARDEREAAARDEARAAEAVAVRKTRVQSAVERRIWTEMEPEEAETWTADLAERLDDEALEPGFIDETVDDHIERAARELGLAGAEGELAYVPRALRHLSRVRSAGRWRSFIEAMEFDEEEGGADAPDDEPPPAAPLREAPPREAPPPTACTPDGGPPAAIPEPPPRRAPEPEPPPDGKRPTDPSPEPPPQPYAPPWERIPPNGRFPGGSGY